MRYRRSIGDLDRTVMSVLPTTQQLNADAITPKSHCAARETTAKSLCILTTPMKKNVLLANLGYSVFLVLASLLTGCASNNSSGGTGSVPTPTIQSISPSNISAGSSAPVQIVIAGSGFAANSQVQISGTAVSTTFVSSTQLQATIPISLIASGVNLVVTVVNGSVSSDPAAASASFTVTNPAPTIASIMPASALIGSNGQNVTITGTGFVPTSAVNVNGVAHTATFSSSTQITVALTAPDLSSAGTLNLVAVNPAPGGGSSSATPFTVSNPIPSITSVLPTSVTEGSAGFTLDVKGSGFVVGSTVFWNKTALSSTLVSPAEMTAAVPATLLAVSSSNQISVVTPAPGGQSATAAFSVLSPVPTLISILPGIVRVNQPAAITLSGSGFAADSVVLWNGSPRPTTLVTATTLSVALTAADLSAVGTGQLTVANPSPGGGTTAALNLSVTNLPIPTVTGVSFTVPASTACPQIQMHVTGTNFLSAQALVNGILLQGSGSGTDLYVGLPNNFSAAPGSFVLTVKNNIGSGVISDPYSLPASVPPVLALCAMPVGADIYPGTNFLVNFLSSQVNVGGTPAITSITLPTGITSVASFPFNIASGGTRVQFSAGSALATGAVSIPFSGSLGTTNASGVISLTVPSTVPQNFYFLSPLSSELGVPIGGSGSISFSSSSNNGPTPEDFTVDLSVSGLPQGTAATITPATIMPGDSFTVTIRAAANAPVTQNATVTISGTPSANVPAATGKFALDVTQPPGSLPGNRTDFVSTAGTPNAVVYDRPLDLIFASNPSWNRIDVLSNRTHQLLQSIPLRNPQALDVTQDGSTLWIGTNSQQVFAMDTTTFALTRYTLPGFSGAPIWEDNQLLTLADGTLMLNVSPSAGSGIYANIVWTPGTNQLTVLPTTDYLIQRSGDGTKAFATTYASGYTSVVYSVATKALTSLPLIGQGYSILAVNQDGSRLVGGDNGLYDGSAGLIGKLPTYLTNSTFAQYGTTVFSPDGTTLYQIASDGGYGSFIATIDVPTLSLKGIAPGLATLPNGVSETPVETTNISVDGSGMLIGTQTYGIGFEDSTFFQSFGTNTSQPGPPVSLTPRAGSLSGGTVSVPYGYFNLTPDVWYGPNRGTAAVDTTNTLRITSPQGNQAGPVNLKYIYPDGAQVFTPQAFSYSTYPQYSVLSGASPDGGVPGRISGYGMPADASGGTLTVGGNSAAITTTVGQYPPYTGEAFPSTYLDYTIPAGNPGYADLAITTPIGSGMLPKAVFYAKSVADYGSSDTFTDVLYDPSRLQVYLSGNDHIDVFSLASKQWLTPLKPATVGSNAQFRGLALTPDGSQLLAVNFLDGSLGIINPDSPSQTFAIAIPGSTSSSGTCATGPTSVAALAGGQAFVATGLPTGIGGCPYNDALFIANLQTRTVGKATSCSGDGSVNESSTDGTLSIVAGEQGGICLYVAASNSFITTKTAAINYYGVSIAGDGNLASVGNAFLDASGNMLGSLSRPVVLFKGLTATPYPLNNYPANSLQRPRLNAAGSLYYWAYPTYFEIFDVPTATLRLRFSLAETVQNVETPIAIDSGGRQVFLITNAGLTVVDLGSAPLSIGHLSSSIASTGTKVKIRGSGFQTGITATLGGQPAAVDLTDENTLSITIPTLISGLKDLTLANPDGSTYVMHSALTVP